MEQAPPDLDHSQQAGVWISGEGVGAESCLDERFHPGNELLSPRPRAWSLWLRTLTPVEKPLIGFQHLYSQEHSGQSSQRTAHPQAQPRRAGPGWPREIDWPSGILCSLRSQGPSQESLPWAAACGSPAIPREHSLNLIEIILGSRPSPAGSSRQVIDALRVGVLICKMLTLLGGCEGG